MTAPDRTVAMARRLRSFVGAGDDLSVPLPGSGSTWRRWRVLAAAAAEDLSWGRVLEGHLDAVAILSEADRRPHAGAAYGVFAARGPDSTVVATPAGDGWRLDGTRRYATGVRVLDRALLDVDGPDGPMLLDVDLSASGVDVDPSSWVAIGMAATDSVTMALHDVEVAGHAIVGAPDFYVDRPGFGHGGGGVAACWWGGAVGLVRDLVDHAAARPDGPRRRAVVAAAIAVRDAGAALQAAAADLDRDPEDVARSRERAATLRWSVVRACRDVLGLVQDGGGTHPATADRDHARRLADLPVYLTQFGGPVTLDSVDPRAILPDLDTPGRRPGGTP